MISEWQRSGRGGIKSEKSGSDLSRTAMGQGLLTSVEVKRCRPLNLPVVNWMDDNLLLCGALAHDVESAKGRMPIKLAPS
ncbi:hypothetical protein DO97_06070 [Neosynechococcus sphagnicola sy1]|uniref:Uncharacterized protein n=2 Tax=Neosynechococcus TaxID=1501143 RepID=A0A098TNS2_9CYAN|nr:hypothetical protein DO97_06070 [Neosynechococcus sphagnicola sy1]